MVPSNSKKRGDVQYVRLDGRQIAYRLIPSRSARKLRVRVGPNGIDVIQPAGRPSEDVTRFLRSNEKWILEQLQRAERLRAIRRPDIHTAGEILYQGKPTRVRTEKTNTRARGNKVALEAGDIVIRGGRSSKAASARSLELWLRKKARDEIGQQLDVVAKRLNRVPRRVYIMDQQTKWGNCSRLHNLSFSWRLIMAPDFVLRYLVTHEVVHLAVPDHSAKFWLTVQSFCPEMERAKQWLCANAHRLYVDLGAVCSETTASK